MNKSGFARERSLPGDMGERRRRGRRRWALLMIAASVCVCLTCCLGSFGGKYASGLPAGYISKEEHFDRFGFQDYTDYCKYQYDSIEPFQNDERYHILTEGETDHVKGYFMNFRKAMEAGERLDEYDFPSPYSCDDYVYIDTKEGQPIGQTGHYYTYDSYNVYYFDTESMILYFIHHNI